MTFDELVASVEAERARRERYDRLETLLRAIHRHMLPLDTATFEAVYAQLADLDGALPGAGQDTR